MDPALQAADPLAIAVAVSEEMASQPELFGAAAFSPEELETVRIARAGRYNASRTRSEARVAVVVALRQQGASLREIERRTGMDPRLVSVVLREAERHQVVPAMKEVLQRRLAETTERALDRLDQEIVRDEPDPQLVRSLGVVAGIGADKLAAASNPAGDLHLHQHVHLASGDPAREYLRQRAEFLSIESGSTAADAISKDCGGLGSGSAGHAASPCIDLDPAPTPTGPRPDQAPPAGGGRPAAGPGGHGDGMD